ncbi:MAG: DUF3181 family protein [Cyanobacteria bacterium P01_G01_bin.19]
MASTQDIENLAVKIGENVYIDVAKWHLYLSDAKLHTVVAEKVYPLLEDDSLSEDAVTSILQSIPIKLGGGTTEIALEKLLPMQCKVNLLDLLEEYQKDM